MKKIIFFLLSFLVVLTYSVSLELKGILPQWLVAHRLVLLCALAGGYGGCVYCLRAVYLNACVWKRWDDEWQPWYYIRPFVSLVCGGVSWLFLSAGLLLLESGDRGGSTDLGFFALAFVAGLNVDRFINKVEEIAQATWGIEKSRTARKGSARYPIDRGPSSPPSGEGST
jgi:hypothetical protein